MKQLGRFRTSNEFHSRTSAISFVWKFGCFGRDSHFSQQVMSSCFLPGCSTRPARAMILGSTKIPTAVAQPEEDLGMSQLLWQAFLVLPNYIFYSNDPCCESPVNSLIMFNNF